MCEVNIRDSGGYLWIPEKDLRYQDVGVAVSIKVLCVLG